MTHRSIDPRQAGALTARLVDDDACWDSVEAELSGHLVQGWRWGVLTSCYGWLPLRLLLSQDGAAVAAAQMRLRRLGPVRVAYVPRGPMRRYSDEPALVAMVTAALNYWARRERAVALYIEPDCRWSGAPRTGSLERKPGPAGFHRQRTIKIRVDRSDDELLQAVRPKTRYTVRLAQRRGVSTRIGGLGDLPQFYRLLTETSERDGFGIYCVEYLRAVLTTSGGDAAVVLAEVNCNPAAAIIVVRQGPEALYLYGATAARHQRHMPSYLVQFGVMQWARAEGCHAYDLWGIPPEEGPRPESAAREQTRNVRAGSGACTGSSRGSVVTS